MLEAIREDINRFREEKQVDRVVMIWAASTEIFIEPGPAHMSSSRSRPRSTPTIRRSRRRCSTRTRRSWKVCRSPTAHPTSPSTSRRCASWPTERKIPISGKDFKTGQTLIKTVIGPMLKARMLGLSGWYSTNILGNRDGEVLDDPDNFKTKEESKLGVLEHILDPESLPGAVRQRVPQGADQLLPAAW